MQQVKIHGAFRTGTNYAKALFELNYDVEVVATHGGWKHAPVPALFNRDHGWPILGIVRDPFAWLVSLWNYVQRTGNKHVTCGTTWRTFLTGPITITHGFDDTVPAYRFASPVDYWNALAANLASLGERGQAVRYEDLLTAPESTSQKFAAAFGLDRTSTGFVQIKQRTRNMVDRPRSDLDEYVTDEPFDATSVLSDGHLDNFTRRDFRAVNRLLDAQLVDRLGY